MVTLLLVLGQNKLLECQTFCHNSTICLHVIKAFMITSECHIFMNDWNTDISSNKLTRFFLTLKFSSHRHKTALNKMEKQENNAFRSWNEPQQSVRVFTVRVSASRKTKFIQPSVSPSRIERLPSD